jgi:hypothetical protein
MALRKHPDKLNAVIRSDARKHGKTLCKFGRRLTKARRLGRQPL